MKLIENLSAQPNQITHVLLDDGSFVQIGLTYRPAIQRWQIDIVHPNLTMYGKTLSNHPNILRQFRNTAGFGLACILNDGTEPNTVNDFDSGRAQLYILNTADIAAIETDVFGMTGVLI